MTRQRPLIIKVVSMGNMVQSIPLILACGGFNNRLVSACGLVKLSSGKGRRAMYCSKFPEPKLCPILTPEEIGNFRSRFPESFQKPTRDTLVAVESLPPWKKAQADTKASHALVAAILNTRALAPSCHTPQTWSVQQVCTQLLLKQAHAPRARYQAAHEPPSTPIWEILTKLVPPHVSIYYPWADPGKILK